MVAKLQEIKSEKKLKASGDDENSQKHLSGDFPRSDKTEHLGGSGRLWGFRSRALHCDIHGGYWFRTKQHNNDQVNQQQRQKTGQRRSVVSVNRPCH